MKLPPRSFKTADLTTNRNQKMIQALLEPNANGMFLFIVNGIGTTIISPPGLKAAEIDYFKQEFLVLFEKYAKIANRGRR